MHHGLLLCLQPSKRQKRGNMKLTCLWQDCPRGRTMPSGYCIEHHHIQKGLPCPEFIPLQEGGWMEQYLASKPAGRPALERNRVFAGRQLTSRQAALRAYPRTGTQRHRIWSLMTSHDGLTADEVNERTGISPNTINPTIRGLVLDGWLEDSGERRMTRAGNDAIVWRPIP